MATFEGQYLTGEVALDGNQFLACDFVDVTFTFAGDEGFEFGPGCTYLGKIRLKLGNRARMALLSLVQMFNSEMLGPAIRQAIEHEFAKGADSLDE